MGRSTRGRCCDWKNCTLQTVVGIAAQRDHLGAQMYLDVRQSVNAIDQILRHRCSEVGAAHHQMQRLDLVGEKNDCLAGGISGTDQRDMFARAQGRLDRRSPVGHARAFEPRQVGDLGSAITHTRGDHDGARLRAAIARELQAESGMRTRRFFAAMQIFHGDRYRNFRTEFLRLGKRAPGQCLPEMPVGKPR